MLRIPTAPCFFLPSPLASGEKSISVLHCMALPRLTIWLGWSLLHLYYVYLNKCWLRCTSNLKPENSNLLLWVQLFRVHPCAHFPSISRQHRERKETPSDSLLHNSIFTADLTQFQVTLKEEISLDKEQALATCQTLQHLGQTFCHSLC